LSTGTGPAARLFVALQHLLPQHLLSLLMYGLARVEWAPVRAPLVRLFIALTGIRLDEAETPDAAAYPHLNALFTRPLRSDARPLDPDPRAVLAPVDGVVSELGEISDGRLIQAKGQDYALADLLGGTEAHHLFDGGSFATLYLSPKDYHRIHMPLTGDLVEMSHLDGRLFSVNAVTAALVPGLFVRNERVVCLFGTDAGPMAMVLVGAIFVGGIETVWEGEVTPAPGGTLRQRWSYTQGPRRVHLERGAEMGRFNLGSTVVLLFPPGAVAWDGRITRGTRVRFGERMGGCRGGPPPA
jgi:phosphatidylserine decarboxylase